VLVTGGAGFIGATLVRRLVASGYLVRVLDNLSTGDAAHLKGVDAGLVRGDIRDAGTLDEALAGCDAVIHLAAAGSVVGSVADPAANFEANVAGTFRVLDAARRNEVPRVVLASTGGALIGDAAPPVDERSLPKPLSPYGASKLAGEGYAHAWRLPSPRSPACAAWPPGARSSTARPDRARSGGLRLLRPGSPPARLLPTVCIEDGIPRLWQWFKSEVSATSGIHQLIRPVRAVTGVARVISCRF
jgi:nucleoside-diphosphate-sugar epimerase